MSEPRPRAATRSVHSSLSKPLFIWSALLVVALGWGLYDEVYGIRPWKGYEARFASSTPRTWPTPGWAKPGSSSAIKASPEYRRLDAEMQAAEKAALPEASAIDRRINRELVPKILALNDPFQEIRSHIGALTYQIEVSHSASRKNALRQRDRRAASRGPHHRVAGRAAASHEFRQHLRAAPGHGRMRRRACWSAACR